MNKNILSAFAGMFLIFASQLSNASTIKYRMDFKVDTVYYVDDIFSYPCGTAGETFDCLLKVGDTFSGTFELHDDIRFLADGIYSFIPIDAWRVEAFGMVWDKNLPSAYEGFRDGLYCNAEGTGFSVIGPGLKIKNGEIVGFCGGVVGHSDANFIDFDYVYSGGRYGALAGDYLSGTYTITYLSGYVSEPSTILLIIPGIYFLSVKSKRMRSSGRVK